MKVWKSFALNEYLLIVYRIAVLLVFYALLRVLFYAFNCDLFPSVTLEGFACIMLGGMRFDISAIMYINALFILFYILSFGLKMRKNVMRVLNAIFFVFNGIGFATCCIDFIYYRFILKRTTFNVLDILQGEQNMVALWLQFLVDYWYVFLLFALIMWLFVRVTLLARPCPTPIRRAWGRVVFGVVVLAVVSGLSVAAIRGGFRHSTRPITISNAAAYTTSPEESAIVLNTPFSIIRTIGKKSFEPCSFFSAEEADSIFSPVKQYTEYQDVPLRRRNVVVFILESFSREFLSSFNPTLEDGRYEGYTPFLDSLAEHSLIFTNAFANGRKSIDAMPSILASVPSLQLPYVVSEYSNNRVNSLASLLGKEGYRTEFFHGAPNGSMGFDSFAKIAGFDAYKGKDEYDNDDDFDGIWGIWDDKFFSYFADELAQMKEPFCAALFSLSSHHPFKVPAEYEGRFPKGSLPVEECIGYSDYALRLFFEKAQKEAWFDSTLFVITADHSGVPDHDEYNNNMQAFAVPIMFYAPGDSTLVGVDRRLAQQTDIMPSVLSYLHYSKPFVSFGNNLFDESVERFTLNYNNDVYQIAMGDSVAYFDGHQLQGLFNRVSDPALRCNMLENGRGEVLLNKAKAYIQHYNNRMINNDLTVN